MSVEKDTVKEQVVEKLKAVIKAVNENDFNTLDSFIAYSPAGDGYGKDNHYIEFGIVVPGHQIDDIQDVRTYLFDLEMKKKKEKEVKREEKLRLKNQILALKYNFETLISMINDSKLTSVYISNQKLGIPEGRKNRFKKLRNRLEMTYEQFAENLKTVEGRENLISEIKKLIEKIDK
jgi:hypothetical protein